MRLRAGLRGLTAHRRGATGTFSGHLCLCNVFRQLASLALEAQAWPLWRPGSTTLAQWVHYRDRCSVCHELVRN
jgi:hypothetical protein